MWSWKTSYQSPPILMPEPAGRYLALKRIPGICGSASGSSERCMIAVTARCSEKRALSIASAARSAASCSSVTSSSSKCTLDERADVHHADDATFDVDGHAEHRADAPLPEDRVYDVGVVEVLDDDRACLGGDAACEAAGERHLDALADLLLEPACGACNEDAAILVEQQHGCGVDFERRCGCARAARRACPPGTCIRARSR